MPKSAGNAYVVDMKQTRIAIFGSTSHIAKGLIYHFFKGKGSSLHLYTGAPDKVRSFLSNMSKYSANDAVACEGYGDFMQHPYDVVINCVGVGTMNKLQGNYTRYFTVGEEYDNLAINYLHNVRPETLYISFSSGVVYGKGHSAPAEENTANCLKVNHISSEDYYAITRLNSEAKHRAFKNLNIVDLRVFSYFSRFIDLEDSYFITELLKSILKKRVFVTDNLNIVRDYIHPKDLFAMIGKCMEVGRINGAFDMRSSNPVDKKVILDYFSSEYGLKHTIVESLGYVSATGAKDIYCSNYDNASVIGHRPKNSSMDTIRQEAEYILSHRENV
jgi:nucleoside-diphosphate-sugar epimerase